MNDGERDEGCNDCGERIEPGARGQGASTSSRASVDLDLHARDEAVPHPRDRLYERWLLRAVAEDGAQAVEGHVKAVIEVHCRIGPQARAKFVTCHHPAWFFEKQGQEVERLAGEPKRLATTRQPHPESRELELAELQDRPHTLKL